MKKRAISLLLAAVMTLSLALPAWAAEEPAETPAPEPAEDTVEQEAVQSDDPDAGLDATNEGDVTGGEDDASAGADEPTGTDAGNGEEDTENATSGDTDPEESPEPEEQEIPLESIAFNQNEITVKAGEVLPLELTFTPEDTTDDKTVSWTTTALDVVRLNAEGRLVASGVGRPSSGPVWES